MYVCQEQLESSKRGWELQQLQKLKEEEEERQLMEGDEDLFTYTREDAYNMVSVLPSAQLQIQSRVDREALMLTCFPLSSTRSTCSTQRTDTQRSCR